MNKNSTFLFHDPDNFQRLRSVFETAGYTNAGVLERLGVRDFPSIRENDLQLLLRRTSRDTPLDTLIRLFLIETPCDIEAVKRALQPMKIETLAETGIIRIDGSLVTATIKLLPYDNLLVAFDQSRMLQTDLRQNYVMGIGSSTLTLANVIIRRHSRLTLDLGTGCGVHAFMAAQHSDYVIATDINPRAVQIASFNASLNGLTNIVCLEGDLFDPVKERKFDLVITNPPFVISPETRYIYRDGGMEADQVCRKIVREVPQYLNEGGYCQILCNWIEPHGQEWHKRLQSWVEGAGCDVWVMRSETRDAETYASTWIRHTEKDDNEDQFAQRFEKWMTYYEQQGINSVGAGLITIRRRSGSHLNWYRADDAPEKMLGPCGDYIVLGFELRDFLETAQDNTVLLNTRFHVSPDVRLERQSAPSAEGWADETIRLRLKRGLAYEGNIDSSMANVIVRCDGNRPLKDLLKEMAGSLGADISNITSAFCDLVRKLVERGFLLPP